MTTFALRTAKKFAHVVRWERIIPVGFTILAVFLAFYNLQYNPRPWHDEGSALSVSKTLAEDGIYASRNSDGYQTFGAVQSVGPTVLVPIAISFKLFGVGLLQGRVVMALYMLLTLAVFYRVGLALFGRSTALLAILLLIGSPAARFLWFGRQALGEVPALCFFLLGWLAWSQSMHGKRIWSYVVSGSFIGTAMVTKSSYMLIGFGTLTILAILDLIYYRQRIIGSIIGIGLVAMVCVVSWWAWQLVYYGTDIFRENADKLSQLGAATTGFNISVIFAGIKFLIGADSGHFYYLWGFAALVYAAVWSLRRDRGSMSLAFLLVFTLLWLGYYLWSMPWLSYVFAPAAVSALFVARLWHDLAGELTVSPRILWAEVQQGKPAKATLALAALIGLALILAVPLQATIRNDILKRDNGSQRLVAFLNRAVEDDVIIETWERELTILTNHRYHFPDQATLTAIHAAAYRNNDQWKQGLGADYFQKYQPSYLVVGWFARRIGLYDANFLASHAHLLQTIGDGEWSYDVYSLHLP